MGGNSVRSTPTLLTNLTWVAYKNCYPHIPNRGDSDLQTYIYVGKRNYLGRHWWENCLYFNLKSTCSFLFTMWFWSCYTQFLSSTIFYVLFLFHFIFYSCTFLEYSSRSTNNQGNQIKTVRSIISCLFAGKIMITQFLKCGNFLEPSLSRAQKPSLICSHS